MTYRTIVGLTSAVGLTVALIGCASSGTRAPTASPAAMSEGELDDLYLIGPTPARELGYRILYQAPTTPDGDSGIKGLAIEDHSVYVLDGHNFVTRLRRRDGEHIWRIPVASPLNEVQGITYVPSVERVFLTVGGDIYELDDDTGSLMNKQELGQIASTPPVLFGGLFIYGARNGQVVWHSWNVGHTWRAYQVSPAMRLTPLIVGDLIVAVGSDGRVMVIDAPSAAGLWDKRLLNGVEAQHCAGNGVVYIAGLDQYLWAIDINNGRTHWKHLTETPLRSPPTLIGDAVYQHIPGEGLHCFTARPVDMPGGQIRWIAPEIDGNVIGRDGHRLIVWDEPNRTVTLLDADRGSVISTVPLPSVRHLYMTELVDGDMFAASDDGRVTCLVPKNRSKDS